MSLTGTTRRVAQVIGIFGGLFFALIGYDTLPTIFYYTGVRNGNWAYVLLIGWVVAWFVLGYFALYGLVSMVAKITKKIWPHK